MPDENEIDTGVEDEEDSVEVVISTESSEANEAEASGKPSDELEDYSSGVKSRINNLTKRFREEERQKQTAIEYAENVTRENKTLKDRIGSLDKGFQDQFESRVTHQIASSKEILKQAHETGDVDKIIEAQESLADLSVEKGALRAARAEYPRDEAPPEERPRRDYPSNPPARAQAPPDPKAEAWAGRNNWFGQDEVMTYGAFGIHRRLVEEEGFDPQSQEYYAELDSRLRTEFPHKFNSSPKYNGGSRKVASAEGSASRNKSGRKSVRLNGRQIDMAKRLNVPLEEYAKYVRT
jgi:hypothetical protein